MGGRNHQPPHQLRAYDRGEISEGVSLFPKAESSTIVRMPDDVPGIRQGTIIPEKTLPQVAFLGFAERSEQVRDSETVSLKWNVLGLKNVLLVNFLPIPLIGWKLGMASRFLDISKPLKIMFRAESGEDIGIINLQFVKDNPT